MKATYFFIITIIVFTTFGCTSKKNSSDFIKKVTGRYYFNADEVIEVHFTNAKLLLNWRNQNLNPLKLNDSTFYVREMNEKLIFNPLKNNIELAVKREHKGKKYVFNKLKEGEKTPSEYLAQNNYEMALKGYINIKKNDSLNPVIKERNLNRLGYRYIRNDDFDKAINVFKINTILYPKSSNTFDSLGDAYFRIKDTLNAIDNYKKALAINPENRSSKRNLEKLTKK